jgi:methionyl-tRNA synthetase
MTKFLITSAIPYVNGVKHLGNLVGSLLPADVQARFRRQLGDEVLFICGTDEHGTPSELAAAHAGLPIREFVTASMPGKPIFISVSACRSTTSDGRRHRPITG